jgi:hypothetical protein
MKFKILGDVACVGQSALTSTPGGTHTTVTIGGDPTVGHQISRFNVVMTDEQWTKLVSEFPHLKNLDFGNASVNKVPNLRCCCCDKQLPHTERLEKLLLYSHVYSSIQIYRSHDEPYYFFIFVFRGSSEHHGCIHKVLDALQISY